MTMLSKNSSPTLNSLVKSYLIRKGQATEHGYPRMLQIAVDGLRELNMDSSGYSKTVVLPINDNMTVDLPNDYIDYTKIAVCGTDGNLHHLGWNRIMCRPRKFDDCGDINRTTLQDDTSDSDNLNNALFTYYEGGNYRNGEFLGRFFGLGGGVNRNGYYRIDPENNFIALQSIESGQSEIFLEYLADINRVDDNYHVHPFDTESLLSWMYWQDIRMNRTYPANEKQIAKNDYYRHKKLSKRRHRSFTLDEAYQTIRTAFKLSVRL